MMSPGMRVGLLRPGGVQAGTPASAPADMGVVASEGAALNRRAHEGEGTSLADPTRAERPSPPGSRDLAVASIRAPAGHASGPSRDRDQPRGTAPGREPFPIPVAALVAKAWSRRRTARSSTTDTIKGLANEAVGNVKQGIGSATGNDKLKAEGKAQELKGEAQKTTGDVKDGAKHVADKVTGKV